MTRAASLRESLLLAEPPDVVLDQAVDLVLGELLSERWHVFAAVADLLDQLVVLLRRLPLGVREIAGHELLAARSVSRAVLAVALRAVLDEEGRGVLVARLLRGRSRLVAASCEQDRASRPDRRHEEAAEGRRVLHSRSPFHPFFARSEERRV